MTSDVVENPFFKNQPLDNEELTSLLYRLYPEDDFERKEVNNVDDLTFREEEILKKHQLHLQFKWMQDQLKEEKDMALELLKLYDKVCRTIFLWPLV